LYTIIASKPALVALSIILRKHPKLGEELLSTEELLDISDKYL
jgi:hypothetical protein